MSISAATEAKKQPPGIDAALDVLEEALGECRSCSMPVGAAMAGSITVSVKRVLAVSIVASCSSSLEPKWANRPLLLIPTASASRPIERPVDALDRGELCGLAQNRVAAALTVAAALADSGWNFGCEVGVGHHLTR